MSVALKLQLGGETPSVYNFYGKQYTYDDLAREADLGLNDYLLTLSRGNKDQALFRDAYANFMSGIKDGSITYEDGRFHDSKGRYRNADKASRDYYGLIANYIYGKMGKSDIYTKPKDSSKIQWDDNSMKTALMRQIFNRDTGSLQDFLDLDAEKNGVRSIANRSTYLGNAFQSIADNWDTLFEGYSDADKNRYLPLLRSAASAVRDGKLDPGDYLALSRAIGGVDFREMLATGSTIQSESVSPSSTPSESAPKLRSTSLADNYNLADLTKMSLTFSMVPSKALISILRNSFYNRNYTFRSDYRMNRLFGSYPISNRMGVTAVLNALQSKGLLKPISNDNPNIYYIPGLRTKKGTAWVWDKTNNSVAERKISDIPYLVQRHAKGGIIKASGGTKLDFRTGLTDYDPYGYEVKRGRTLRGINDKGVYGDPYTNSGNGVGLSRVKTDSKYQDFTKKGRDYALAVENLDLYKKFTDELVSSFNDYNNALDKSSLNDDNNLFLAWSHSLKYPNDSAASFFDANGNLRTSWTTSNNDYYGNKGRTITNGADYIRALRTDQLLADAHNDFLNEGTRYYYKDDDGNRHYIDPNLIKSGKYKYNEQGTQAFENNVNWTDHEVTGLANPNDNLQPDLQPDLGTNINMTNSSKNTNWWQQNGEKLIEDTAPELLAINRLNSSIRANNKIASILKKAIHPDLKSTYDLYSPITGAFSEMQFRNQLAADVQRQGNRATTSDASLEAAKNLEANRQANTLQLQGFLADDQEIKRTKAEALQRQENNKARRTEVANYNNTAINAAEKQRADIDAGLAKSNWQSKESYKQGIEQRLRQNKADRDAYKKEIESTSRSLTLQLDAAAILRPYQIREHEIDQRYQDTVHDLLVEFDAKKADYERVHGEGADYSGEQFYKDFVAKTRAARDLNYKDKNDLAEEASNALRQFYESLRSKQRTFRNGGSLSKSSIDILNSIFTK